jgi:glyoxylase-like metal-dependent hydrolase (beta-lactamase superfamily II)
MQVQKFTFNPFQENTYILYDESKECIIIDPGSYSGAEQDQLFSFIESHNLKPVKLVNTHCHIDHICGNKFVADTWNLELEASLDDAYNLDLSVQAGIKYGVPIVPSPEITVDLKEGATIRFGNSELQILSTPGHSKGSLSFYAAADQFVIAGDALFQMSIGRTDLPGGDYDTLIQAIRTKLFTLSGETLVYSGHGDETTIEFEIKNNPFLNA